MSLKVRLRNLERQVEAIVADCPVCRDRLLVATDEREAEELRKCPACGRISTGVIVLVDLLVEPATSAPGAEIRRA